jgi:hypothetical protein
MRLGPWWPIGLVCLLGGPSTAHAQATGQSWTNLTFSRLASERLSYELDVEPKAQLTPYDGARWLTVETTGHIDRAVTRWMDVVAEMAIAPTSQSNEANFLRVAPRVGVHLHILSRLLRERGAGRGADREKHPTRRLVAGTLLRLENPRTFYRNDAPTESTWRIRHRFELAYPLNRPKTTTDGAIYLSSDCEAFVPVGEEVPDGVVSQLRIRGGLGHRRSFAWRIEAFYVWNGERHETSGVMVPQSHALEVRIRRQF